MTGAENTSHDIASIHFDNPNDLEINHYLEVTAMPRLSIILTLSMLSATASAFSIVSDPWPTTGAQPTSCEATEGTKVYSNAVVANADGSVFCKIDIGTPSAGKHTYSVVAKSNQVGVTDSAAVPLSWSFGTIATPFGLRVIP